MTTRTKLSLTLLLFCCSTFCKAQSVADTAAIKQLLTGIWKQDFRMKANHSLFTRPGHPGVLKDNVDGYRFNFRKDFVTDDNSPSGEKIPYRLRQDSVIVIAEKYLLKIEKLTKDSLVYRMGFYADFKFNEKPLALNRYHCHRLK
ncbi:hypothetical protein WJU16_20595 [Chitinophaga pollutisoli]|uniref:Uncharacterized protein n=1 Tax=Chitinophaga pollutisoli TaxID=3133966 RepID=A0ABZ2YMI6_9BACT